ncbi:endonuclease/exonuclease/phosphatase family protein [Nocardioides pantholopis]|uniref:endonuclease/exonuclease/phosphatase family protein n=1 Tax=Nocardioides pantholopis TaxID=2483798 RepID=UPI000FDA5EE3|nr:endonuclease/exonuclease/phosphatase family protein [Nocardioides pantholopis]
MSRWSRRTPRSGLVGLVGLALVGPLAGPGAGHPAAVAEPAQDAGVYEVTCARAAPAPALRVRGRAADREQRGVRAVAARGQALGVPARAQALAVAAHLAGGLSGDPSDNPSDNPSDDDEAASFYRRLVRIDDWTSLPPTLAIHRVLKGPDPFAYESAWASALVALAGATGRSPASVTARTATGALTPASCRSSAGEERGLPLPEGTGYLVRNAGAPATPAAPGTTPAAPTAAPGTEPPAGPTPSETPGRSAQPEPGRPAAATLFEASCGTPVLAATAGRVRVADSPAAAGRWLVEVRSGAESVWYSHVQQPSVKTGDVVVVGQPIAEVGDLGDVERCALGLALRRQDGAELAGLPLLRHLLGSTTVRGAGGGAAAPGAPATVRPRPPAPTATTVPETIFRAASFNVLGHHLTAPGGSKKGYAAGTTRMAQALALLERQQVSVVVLNEFESEQAGVVTGDGDWGLHRATPNDTFRRSGSTGGNAIAWRSDTWELVDTTEVQVAWERTLHMPVVLLRHLDTGATVSVMGVHNPASTAKQGDQQGARERARATELAFVTSQLEATQAPLLLAGDFNERDSAFCGMTATGLLTSSAGGSSGPGCSPPRHGPVDWIFGSQELTFTGQYIDRSTFGSISDHPLVIADVVYPAHQEG